MKRVQLIALILLLSLSLHAQDTLAYKIGYKIGYLLSIIGSFLLLAFVAYLVYRFFIKKKSS